MFKLAFRVDGGTNIGMGHIMRCLSLAKEFMKNGFKVYFISKYKDGVEQIKEENFQVIQLRCKKIENMRSFSYGNSNELDKESEEIIKYIKLHKIDLLFIDSYNVSKDYFLKIKPHVKRLAYIDDVNEFTYPVDILINGNLLTEHMIYKKYYEEELMLLGIKYNLIRSEFKDLPVRKVRKEVKEVMITTGGSDPYNMTVKLLGFFLSDIVLKNLIYNVVIGSSFTNNREIREFANQYENIIIYENPSKMSKIMLKSDIAISSGGSTLYELCACGTPTIAFIYADNQRAIVEEMTKLEYIKNVGWYNNLEKSYVVSSLKKLMDNYDQRLEMSKLGKKLVDGRGTRRIFDEIMSNLRSF